MGLFHSKNEGVEHNEQLTKNDIESIIDDKLKEIRQDKVQIHKEVNEEFENLRKKHEMLLNHEVKLSESVISDEAIDNYVKELVSDPKVNIYGFPDSMEKALYQKLLKTILHAVSHISEESAILLFGHRISIIVKPVNKEKEEYHD